MGLMPWFSSERPLTGTTRLVIGFVLGALFALLPMYYFFMAREAEFRGGGATEPLAAADGPSRRGSEPAKNASNPFAARMTYELSQLPEELPPPRPKPPAPQIALAQPAKSAAVPAPAVPREDAVATPRVVNARPITAAPPDARDSTREMGREARRPDYQELAPKAPPKALVQTPAPRVIEGRDIEVTPSPPTATPTRPIAAASVNTRQEIEAERRRPADNAAPASARTPTGKKPVESRTAVAAAPTSAVMPDSPPAAQSPKVATAVPPKFVVVTPPPSAAETVPGDLVSGRLAATRDWLSAAPPTMHTIQLMGAGSEAQLKIHLRALAKSLDPARIYIYRTVAQGKPSITVVYGAYPDRQSALQALEKLPAEIKANKPVLRTVNGIRVELKQHGTSG